MSVEVKLSLAEFAVAVQSAMTRMLVSAGSGINHASTYKRTLLTRLQEETVGCCGELAIGKLTDRYFLPEVGTFHTKPDCFDDIEIRSTAVANGRMIIRENDEDSRRYVFCVVTGNTVAVVGWLYGHEAKKPEYRDNPNGYRPAWWVPQNKLRDISTLEFTCEVAA